MKQKTKRVNFNVPEELHKLISLTAVANNMTIKMLMTKLVIEELHRIKAVKIKE